jgi:SAM-dependent methyltransferase
MPNLETVGDYFRTRWEIYREIVRRDYMDHEEIYRETRRFIVENYPNPFTLLELGCGDASSSSEMLKGTLIQSYTGIDLAPTGLALAAENLAWLNRSVELKQAEMLDFLHNTADTFDLILTSFALHHLSADGKQLLLKQCWQHLQPGGSLLLIDVFREEGETRPEYLTRYNDDMRTEWRALSSSEIDILVQHIESSDFPETERSIQQWAIESGFKMKSLYNETRNPHKAFALYQ